MLLRRSFFALIPLLCAARAYGVPVYAVSLDERFGVFDDTTGIYNQIGSLPVEYSYGIAFHQDAMYAQDNTGMLLRIDQISGASEMVGNAGIAAGTALFGGGANGLFAIDYASILWSINPLTGAGTRIGATGLKANNGLWETSIASDGVSLYFTAGDGSQVSDELYRIDTTTGRATDLGSTGLMGISGSAYVNGRLELYQYHWDEQINYIYSALAGSTSFTRGSTLDLNIISGGVVTSNSVVPATAGRVVPQDVAAPEPSTLVQILLAGIACMAFRRRKLI